jgi:hypothetical protein
MASGRALGSFIIVFAACCGTQAFAQEILMGEDRKPLRERMDDKSKDGVVTVILDVCKHKDAKVKFEEKERYARFTEDLRALFGKFSKLEAADCNQPFTHTLKYDRSTLKVSAVDKEGKELEAVTVITGPKEHLYLGLDLPVSKRKQLKYDQATQTLQPQDKNPQLYLSINWYFGDLAGKQDKVSDWSLDRLSLKALVVADTRPLDSYGLGLGYQLPKLKIADLSPVSVFVGHFWTKEDRVAASGAAELNQGTGRDWRLGITYDMSSGLKYLKTN